MSVLQEPTRGLDGTSPAHVRLVDWCARVDILLAEVLPEVEVYRSQQATEET